MDEMVQLNDKKEYEMSFVLASEEGAADVFSTLNVIGAEVITKSSLNSIKLAYLIKKHASGYFGFCIFKAEPASVKQLKDALALNAKVLRNLLITPPIKIAARREDRSSGDGRERRSVVAAKPELVEARPAEPQILSNEGLEKKLEEILK